MLTQPQSRRGTGEISGTCPHFESDRHHLAKSCPEHTDVGERGEKPIRVDTAVTRARVTTRERERERGKSDLA